MNEPVRQLRPPPPALNVLEHKLLGGLLDLGEAHAGALIEASGIGPEQIRDVRTSQAWRLVRELTVKRGAEINPSTVHALGESYGLFCSTDGDWLLALSGANTLTPTSWLQIAENLKRRILGVGLADRLEPFLRDLRQGGYHGPAVAAELEEAANMLARSSVATETAASDVLELADVWDHREKTGRSPLLRTGIKVLDEATAPTGQLGGIPPKGGVLYGAPGSGKNMVLAAWMRWQLESDHALHIGGIFCEDGSKWLLKRWTALDLGIPLGAVGVVRRTDEQRAKLEELNPHYHRLLERVHCFRYRRIRPTELIQTLRGWHYAYGIGAVYFDNLRHLDFRPDPGAQFRRQFVNEKRNEQMNEAFDAFAEFADRKEIPAIAAAHTVRLDERQEFRPPRLSEIMDSAGIERACRFALGLWRTRSHELRGTITKNTEGPGTGTTIEFDRHIEAAMVDPDGGRVVNLDREKREEQEARETEAEDRNFAKRKARRDRDAREKAAEKAEAAKNAPPPPQATLPLETPKP